MKPTPAHSSGFPPTVTTATLALLFVGFTSPFFAGCHNAPTPHYRRVDTQSAAYQESVAKETSAQINKGVPPKEAARKAEESTKRAVIKAEKQRRENEVIPLVQALESFEKPRGCWAYTITTKTIVKDGSTTLVERFDPSKPEEKIWTLLSANGVVPDAKVQEDYREKKIKDWKKKLSKAQKKKRDEAEHIRLRALYSEMNVTRNDAKASRVYSFVRDARHMALIGDIPKSRNVYEVDDKTLTVMHREFTDLSEASLLGGSFKCHKLDQKEDFVTLNAALPPFPSKTWIQYNMTFFGKNTGDVEITSEFSDYRKVTCYDDRFEVKVGTPSVTDFMP